MALDIKLDKKNIIPDNSLLYNMAITGAFAAFISFLMDFFGVTILTDFLPKGLELLVIVAISVYIKNILDIRMDGKKIV